MIIDAPRPGDLPRLRQLWQQAFGDSDAFLDGFFSTGFSRDRCRCVKEEGQLAAALYWFDCALENTRFAYIYAVATDPAFQGRGLCRALMEDTQKTLRQLGYSGAALVPGDQSLFALYEKLGYRPFCPTVTQQVKKSAVPLPLRPLTAAQYGQLRRQLLPPGGLLQEGETLSFLSTFAEFYAVDGGVFSAVKEGKTLYVQEYLGAPAALPGAVAALGCEAAAVQLPGDGPDRAMYLPLTDTAPRPGYLGIALN